jgi:hypothetical protein
MPLNPADKQAEQVAKFGTSAAMKRPAQPEETEIVELSVERGFGARRHTTLDRSRMSMEHSRDRRHRIDVAF